MNAYSSDFHQPGLVAKSSTVPAHGPAHAAELADSIAMRWAALHEAAGAVATLAELQQDQASNHQQDFSAMIAAAPSWKADLLRNGVEDIAAFMQAGLTALLAVNIEGRDSAAAALALWNEFEHSRDGLLELASDQ